MSEKQEITATVKQLRTRSPRLPIAKVPPHQAVCVKAKEKLPPRKSIRKQVREIATISW